MNMNMPPPKLLVVSCDPRTRANVERAFSGRGYIVDAAPDAARASELNESEDYDVAVVDEECGPEDGTVLFQTLNDNNGRLDGILCAEEPTIDTVERALEAGMRHVTVKPVDPAEVVSLVEGLNRRFP